MPMVPPAPGRDSNTKPWPICLPTCSNTGRAIESIALPAGNGVISRIGWGGGAPGGVAGRKRGDQPDRLARRPGLGGGGRGEGEPEEGEGGDEGRESAEHVLHF